MLNRTQGVGSSRGRDAQILHRAISESELRVIARPALPSFKAFATRIFVLFGLALAALALVQH